MSDQQQGEVFGAGKATSGSTFQLTSFLKKPIVVFRLAAVVSVAATGGDSLKKSLASKGFTVSSFQSQTYNIASKKFSHVLFGN